MSKSVGSFAEVLRQNGYNTAWYGKNHNIPDWHSSQAGPFDLWPTGLGFEYFYGFIGGDTSQWAPAIFENIKPIDRPMTRRIISSTMTWRTTPSPAFRCCTPSLRISLGWHTSLRALRTLRITHRKMNREVQRAIRQGWDKVREETIARQKAMGIIPADTN